MTKNRAITTGFNSNEQKITLEVLKDTKRDDRELAAGETVEVSRSEAKRLLTTAKSFYRIKMD